MFLQLPQRRILTSNRHKRRVSRRSRTESPLIPSDTTYLFVFYLLCTSRTLNSMGFVDQPMHSGRLEIMENSPQFTGALICTRSPQPFTCRTERTAANSRYRLADVFGRQQPRFRAFKYVNTSRPQRVRTQPCYLRTGTLAISEFRIDEHRLFGGGGRVISIIDSDL